MLTEQDKKQIKNLVISFWKEKKYFPFIEDFQKKYPIFFPENLDEKIQKQIEKYINEIILEEIEKKGTKGGKIMYRILKNNKNLWEEFRKLNKDKLSNTSEFQKYGKEIQKLIENGEDQLTEKLVGSKSMGIEKVSNAWYDMVYAIFPEWNKIKN